MDQYNMRSNDAYLFSDNVILIAYTCYVAYYTEIIDKCFSWSVEIFSQQDRGFSCEIRNF